MILRGARGIHIALELKMPDLRKKLHEYYNTSGASISEVDGYYAVHFRASNELASDAREMANIKRRNFAYINNLDLEKLGAITSEEEGHGLQRVLFWALKQSYDGGYFKGFPEDADVNLAPYSDKYTAPIACLRKIMPCAGRTIYSRIKIFAGRKSFPDFRVEIDGKNLSLHFRKDISFDEMEMYSRPFVGSEEVAFWTARAVDIYKGN